MPVSGHRAKWTSEQLPLVALAFDEHEQPIAFDSGGNAITLRRDHPPTQPVLGIVPIETDLHDQKARNEAGKPDANCEGTPGETLERAWQRCHEHQNTALLMANSTILDGLSMEYVELYDDQCHAECWLWGDPEYEIHVRRMSDGIVVQCAANNPLTTKQPGIKSLEYKWDMNGQRWAGRAKLLNGPQLDAANVTNFTLELWEDDWDACEVYADGPEPGIVIATVVGMSFASWGLADNYLGPALTGVAIIATAWVFQSAIYDDFVGLIATPQGNFSASPNTNAVIVRSGRLIGRVFQRVYDATPPFAGATASVVISGLGALSLPVGTMSQVSAWAVDANGVAASDRTVMWSSSNPSVASIDSYGWVSGNSQGTTTISATIDGVTSSATLSTSFSVWVNGPTSVESNVMSSWTAAVGGGAGPYSYQWYVGETPAGTSSAISMSLTTGTLVSVEVWDSQESHGTSDPGFYVQVQDCTGGGCNPLAETPNKKSGKKPTIPLRR